MKQVIVIRKDLNMRKGKMVAQGAHASMAVFFNRISMKSKEDEVRIKVNPKEWEWIDGLFAKICVSVDSKEELLAIYEKAKKLDLPRALITDSGRTEFHGISTETAVAIGPAEDSLIDTITGNLKLL